MMTVCVICFVAISVAVILFIMWFRSFFRRKIIRFVLENIPKRSSVFFLKEDSLLMQAEIIRLKKGVLFYYDSKSGLFVVTNHS